MTQYVHETPVFRPTKEEFSKPFSEYIAKVLKKYPDVAMFKVVPPEGWRPRRAAFPKLQKLEINCPIKQLVFGTRGSYRCMLVEQKPLTAYEFRDIAEEEGHLPPNKERDKDDKLLERAFWSSLTINPPLYGADTPMSLFDEKLPYGWNLRDLGCLLKQPHIPQVPGVTTPMTYFGMWKSFFAWHVEDADLFSINYLHMGAPKVWYCVSPKDRGKFERMCQSMFPELHAHCHAFLRHKDILLSPSTLKNYGVEYMQAKQEPNEFIVLNAGAYHAGYNLGFNCAEAVNFATQEWVEVGRNVVRCKCDALTEGVRLSMRLFGCSSGSSASSDEEDSDSDDDDDESSSEEESSEEEEADSGSSRGRRRSSAAAATSRGAAAAESGRRSSKRSASAAAAAAAGGRESKRARTDKAGSPSFPAAAAVKPAVTKQGPRQTKTSMAAAAAASKMRRTHATAEARARLAVQHDRAAKRGGSKPGSSGVKKASTAALRKAKPARVINKADTLAESLQRAAAAAAAMRARAEAAAAAAADEDSSEQDVQSEQLMQEEEEQQQQQHAKQEQQQQTEQHHSHASCEHPTGIKHEQQLHSAAAAAAAVHLADAAAASTPVQEPPAAAAAAAPGVLTRRRSSSGANVGASSAPDSPRASRAKLQSGGQLAAAAAAAAGAAAGGPPAGEAPQVIIGEDRGNKHFYMVQVLSDAKPKQRGLLVMRWLKEGRDGLFRPSSDTWEEAPGALVGVRTQWVPGSNGKPGGYRLLTLRSRILDTELVD